MNVLLWDFDGTLAARNGMWAGALISVANDLMPNKKIEIDELRAHLKTGFPWHTPEIVRPYQGADNWWNNLAEVFEKAYVGVGFDQSIASILAKRVRSRYLERNEWQVFEDVIRNLQVLSNRGWTHYVLSNHVPELCDLIKTLGLHRFFEKILTSAQTGYEKPHPEAFLNVVRQINKADKIFMIGDSINADVKGAESVGIPAILVRKREMSLRYCCDSLDEVPNLLGSGIG